MWNEINTLFWKDVRLEWRQKYAFNGILLYIVSTVMVCYLSFNLKSKSLQPITWNALYWIILLFTAVNAIAKSFVQESEQRHYYYYTLASPQAIILAKILYNALLMLFMESIAFVVYSTILGNPVGDSSLFLLNMYLGGVGFATTLTLVSAIASKTQNSTSLMAVLSFPVVIPLLLMLIKVSKNALDDLSWSVSYAHLNSILALNAIVLVLSYVLFPYIWRS